MPIRPVSFKAHDLSFSTPFKRCDLAFQDYNSEECPSLECFNSKTCVFHRFESDGIRVVSRLVCTSAGLVVFLSWHLPFSFPGLPWIEATQRPRFCTVKGVLSKLHCLGYYECCEMAFLWAWPVVLLDGSTSLLRILPSCQSSSAQPLLIHTMLHVFLSHEVNGWVL